MKANNTPTFVSDIELSIIPSTITRQPDGSHKVQLSLNGILTASTNDLPKDLTDEEVRELVSSRTKIRAHVFNWVDATTLGVKTPNEKKPACRLFFFDFQRIAYFEFKLKPTEIVKR